MDDRQKAARDKQLALAAIEAEFSYHAPHGDQPQRYEALRAKARELAELIVETVPWCADRTAAIRKLRECVMTANAAIAIYEAERPPVKMNA